MADLAPTDQSERRITVLDVFMISLALISLGILVYEEAYSPGPEATRRIILIDLAIVAVFAVEFIWRVSRAPDKKAYVKGHWYDILGMIPVSHPMFRAFRLIRILRLVVLTSRFVRATNRSFGQAIVERTITKYKDIIVEELSDRIVLRVLDETEAVLSKGSYGTATARALDTNRDAIVERINSQLQSDRATRIALSVPGVERLVEAVQERTITAVVATLGSDEVNQTIVSVLQEIIEDLRRGVRRKEWQSPKATAGGPAPSTVPG